MIKEIVALEEKINRKIGLLNERQEEIDALKEKIKLFEKESRKDSKQKTKIYNSTSKRFKTLYKNISIDKRAIFGFLDLTEDMKIKSEEIIHKLNENPKLVPVKRKVFSKKGRLTVQEVIFAYNGRLYFQATKHGRIEILTIGTKNTQAKDLEYLDSI
jgi:FtsZ-binding cell division protein ZapB